MRQRTHIPFSYAVQIQPMNGQQLVEYPDGLILHSVEPWTRANRARYPQATKSTGDGFTLITALMECHADEERLVYLVPLEEMSDPSTRKR